MGENLEQEGRLAVRTPMQWNGGKNGGFSDAAPSRLASPVVEGGFSPAHVNVEQQRRDPHSLLSFIQTLVRHYRNAPEFGWGTFAVLEQPHSAIFAHSLAWQDRRVVAVHNFSAEPVEVPLNFGVDDESVLLDLISGEEVELPSTGKANITLEGYGYRWLRVVRVGDTRRY